MTSAARCPLTVESASLRSLMNSTRRYSTFVEERRLRSQQSGGSRAFEPTGSPKNPSTSRHWTWGYNKGISKPRMSRGKMTRPPTTDVQDLVAEVRRLDERLGQVLKERDAALKALGEVEKWVERRPVWTGARK